MNVCVIGLDKLNACMRDGSNCTYVCKNYCWEIKVNFDELSDRMYGQTQGSTDMLGAYSDYKDILVLTVIYGRLSPTVCGALHWRDAS